MSDLRILPQDAGNQSDSLQLRDNFSTGTNWRQANCEIVLNFMTKRDHYPGINSHEFPWQSMSPQGNSRPYIAQIFAPTFSREYFFLFHSILRENRPRHHINDVPSVSASPMKFSLSPRRKINAPFSPFYSTIYISQYWTEFCVARCMNYLLMMLLKFSILL